jgi:macrolide transport system ATP-binding/permease protein
MSLIIKARNIRLDYAGRDVLDIDELKFTLMTVLVLWVITEQERVVYIKVLNGEIALAESDITAVMILHISANLA